jgi:hypothetical protein
MPSTYLIDHAIANVWCAPGQDFQAVISPFRLTNYLGARSKYDVEMGQEIPLPDDTTVFHLFQIGNLHPGFIGIFPKAGTWIRASDHCNVMGMLIDIYGRTGVHLPRIETWIVVLPNRNMLVAIADQGDKFDLSAEQVFLRFYSNAFFESDRSDAAQEIPYQTILDNPANDWANLGGIRGAGRGGDVIVEGVRLKRRNELMLLDARVTVMRNLGFGAVKCYYNGIMVPDFSGAYYSSAVFKEGDWAEFVMDASMREVVQFKMVDLPTFDSTLDGSRKYLLHRPEAFIESIQFKDDLDIYLSRPLDNGRWEAINYYQHSENAMRMVTHQDWSIPVPFVVGYKDGVTGFSNPMEWTVQVHVREAGFLRPLINETSRIKELYKLPPADRSLAMLGINSTLPFWRAPALEAAVYPELMRRFSGNFTVAEVEQAYGYNAISKLLADSPIPTTLELGNPVAVLPVGLQADATVYEYDVDGLLLGWSQTHGTTHYSCRNTNCAFVEGRIGLGGSKLSTTFGTAPLTMNPDVDYFFMKVPTWGGVINGSFTPAVLGTDYVITNGVAHWNLDPKAWLCVVRDNSQFLSYTIQLDATDGLMIFSVQSEEVDPSEPANRVEQVPYGKITLWLNRRTLIENIDYVVRWPQVVICNKEFISTDPLQRVDIRCVGLPFVDDTGEFVRELPLDTGFVEYGQLSHNNHYNVRDDKVQRIVVRGRVRQPSDISYPENGVGASVAGVVNGDPYSVEEVIVPVDRFTTDTTTNLRAAAMERDRLIENYMDQFVHEPTEPNPNPIPARYDVFSPFLAKIIRDLQHGYLSIKAADMPLTDNKTKTMLADYVYLLEYDPYRLSLPPDYVTIHPHDSYTAITLGVYEFYLVQKAVKLYFADSIDTSLLLGVEEGWVPIS